MLRRPADKVLINSLDSETIIVISSGVVEIAGYGQISNSEIVNCYKKCPTACTNKVVTVQVVIPDSCECPYEWVLTVVCEPDLFNYEINKTFKQNRIYTYEDPAGGTPTAAATGTAIAGYINADPNTCVTATANGSGLITLTSKNCETFFNAFTPSGTVIVVTAGVKAVLTATQLAKLFPIQPGHFGARPDLTNCGDYCAYYFLICKSACATQDISAANHQNGYEQEVTFYVRNDLATFQADWDDKITAEFTCLQTSDPCYNLCVAPSPIFSTTSSGATGTGIVTATINAAAFTALGLTINSILWVPTGFTINGLDNAIVMTSNADVSDADSVTVTIGFIECTQNVLATLDPITITANPAQNSVTTSVDGIACIT